MSRYSRGCTTTTGPDRHPLLRHPTAVRWQPDPTALAHRPRAPPKEPPAHAPAPASLDRHAAPRSPAAPRGRRGVRRRRPRHRRAGQRGRTAPTTPPTTTAPTPSADTVSPVVAGEPFPDDRCAANHDAGTISYLTGFDYAAAASMIDVFVAEQRGYYDELCLDVEVTPSFSTANYPIVAAGEAPVRVRRLVHRDGDVRRRQRRRSGGGGGRGTLARRRADPEAGHGDDVEDLARRHHRRQGQDPAQRRGDARRRPASSRGEDYQTVLLDGFDPVAQIALDGIVGFPGYRSNEPGTLERAGIAVRGVRPDRLRHPGSFGVIYTTASFIDDHPTRGRRTSCGRRCAGSPRRIADPDAAAPTALDLVDGQRQPELPVAGGRGVPLADRVGDAASRLRRRRRRPRRARSPTLLQAEVDAYDAVGLFGDAGTHAPTDLAPLSTPPRSTASTASATGRLARLTGSPRARRRCFIRVSSAPEC